ncbi:uncharacterized protein LOC110427327 [Herrania umbratica]|uniref:Uncharacterized protein LOC110427327 n=1 Tax=Herrania umbratica TaxID=108875 RepID=A0A6J1BHB6_9ROSI|nr:uncharacterized protein LOC110427327 [Herrania umbratica]
MKLPEGYKVKGEHPSGSKLACKLHKSLYGLKLDSRQWNAKLTSSIIHYGFKQSFTSTQAAVTIKEYLSSQFKFKDLGIVKYFLGFETARPPQGISLCQRKYTFDLLEEHGFLGAKPVSTPIDYNVKLRKASKEYKLADLTRYRQLVGKLLYLTFIRPNISYAVQTLARFMDKLAHEHYIVAYKVLKYLKVAPGQGILIKAKSNLRILAYCDNN